MVARHGNVGAAIDRIDRKRLAHRFPTLTADVEGDRVYGVLQRSDRVIDGRFERTDDKLANPTQIADSHRANRIARTRGRDPDGPLELRKRRGRERTLRDALDRPEAPSVDG